jgi:saccharopine dehydrogenase-like NADP-dependent oxidoreductase
VKVLVAGVAGVVGRRVAGELAREAGVERLVVTARSQESADKVASLLGSDRVVGAALDLQDARRFVQLARDVDIVVCAAGPHYRFEIEAARAAIDAGTHYISLNDDQSATDRVTALDGAARDAGVTVISGCGVSPGLTNLLVALGAREMEKVEEIDVALAASSADAPGPGTQLHFFAQMSEPAAGISDHSTQIVRAGTSPRLIYFPDPVGWVETFRSGHPEVSTLPSEYPGLASLRYRVGLTERAAMDVVRASAVAGLLKTESGRTRMLTLAEPMRPVLEMLPPRGAPWTAARIDVRGPSGGRQTTVSLAVVDHLSNLATVPLVCGALEILAGKVPTGVVVPERAFDPGAFLETVAERGIRVARLDPASF